MSRSGRKRKIGKREPNGQLSRALTRPADPREVARAARERIHGVAKADSARDLAGTVVGRLFLRKRLTRRHIDAAEAICRRRANYAKAIDMGREEPNAIDLGAAHGLAHRTINARTAERWIALWDEVVVVLGRGPLYAVVYRIAISDRELRAGELPFLRLGLEMVAEKIGLPLDKSDEAA